MMKFRGLGDVVYAITKATGIKSLVDSTVKDCGCEAKRERLNKKYSFKE